jgi:hypothetical protein
MKQELGTPWSLHFDRDGTEDFGIICDAEGNDLVASHLPQSKVARIADRPFGTGCFWLPDDEDEPMPLLVRQMQLMTAAPKLLDMLKVAVATANPSRHKWVKEAQAAIEEATGQEHDQKTAEATPHLHRAAPRMYAALEACAALLGDYLELAKAVDKLLKPQGQATLDAIEAARREAFAALCEARGEIAF